MSTKYGLQIESPFDSGSLSPIIISVPAGTEKVVNRAEVGGVLVIRVFDSAKLTYTESPRKSGVYHTYIVLEGEKAEAAIYSKVISTNDQTLDIIHTISHVKNNTTSSINLKAVLYDTSHIIYQSDILLEKRITSASGEQKATCLLYDDGAQVSAIPKLSVNSNDVQCKHALSISGVDKSNLEYMAARGFSYEEAKKMVTEAFLQ